MSILIKNTMKRYNRILLKLSGESLMGRQNYGIDHVMLDEYASQIAEIKELGIQTAIVIGGGNIFRGLSGSAKGFDRVKGDQMGMLATVINSLALSSSLKNKGVETRVFTAIRMEPIAEFYSKETAVKALEEGNVVIIAGGTGNPYFTTDTASALRAVETGADIMMKGTRVDGVYTADPEKDPAAVKFDKISFEEVYKRNLKVMDLTATTLCQENKMSILVFNMDKKGNLLKAVTGENIGTMVY
jgi:uridylate kinase